MAKPLLFYRKYQRSLRLKACGFSQRAKRSAWKMRQQGAKRVGAPKVRCGFSRLQPVRKMRQQGAQQVGALKVRCMHRSTLARTFLPQAMPGPKTLPLQVGMLYNSRLLTCRSAHQSITIVLPSTFLPTRQSIQSCFPAVCRPAHQSIHLCCPANEKAWIRNSSVGQRPAACCAISLTALAVMRISRSVL